MRVFDGAKKRRTETIRPFGCYSAELIWTVIDWAKLLLSEFFRNLNGMMWQSSFIQTLVVWWFPIDFVIRRLERKKKERKKKRKKRRRKNPSKNKSVIWCLRPINQYGYIKATAMHTQTKIVLT